MQKKELLSRFAGTAEDKLFLSRILDKCMLCEKKSIPVDTFFLDMHQQSFIGKIASYFPIAPFLWGGYPDAERKMLFFLPPYIDTPPAHAFSLLRIRHHAKTAPTHRDYLGALLGLGVSRENVGDILLLPDGAEIFIKSTLEDFFLTHFKSAGRVSLETELLPLSALVLPESTASYKTCTLATLRLDAAVGAAFGVSRSVAADAVASGNVFINDIASTKISALLKEGDKIKWHRHGRVILESVGGESRKGRIFVTFRIYR